MTTGFGPLNAEALFQRVFWPLYPEEVRRDLKSARESFMNPANDCGVTELIDEIAEAFKHLAPGILGIARGELDDTDASVQRLGATLTREMRDKLLAEQTLGRHRSPLLAMIAIHGTLYVGRCIARNHHGRWLVRTPLWESTVQVGDTELAVFQWWLQSCADGEVDRQPLGTWYDRCVKTASR